MEDESSLCTRDTELHLRDRVLGEVEKNILISLPDKGDHNQIRLSKLSPDLETVMRIFITMVQRGHDQLINTLLTGWWQS